MPSSVGASHAPLRRRTRPPPCSGTTTHQASASAIGTPPSLQPPSGTASHPSRNPGRPLQPPSPAPRQRDAPAPARYPSRRAAPPDPCATPPRYARRDIPAALRRRVFPTIHIMINEVLIRDLYMGASFPFARPRLAFVHSALYTEDRALYTMLKIQNGDDCIQRTVYLAPDNVYRILPGPAP